MLRSIQRLLCFVILATSCCFDSGIAFGDTSTLYVGTYTRGTASRGIYVYQFDDGDGSLQPLSIAEGADNPSFLAIHPNKKFLYSADEVDTFNSHNEGAVSAWAIDDRSGVLTLINRQAAGGTGPCHLVVDSAGRNVLVADYSGGAVAVLPIDAEGRLQPAATRIAHEGSSANRERQTSPHPHQIVLDPAGKIVLVPDLGLDQIIAYRFDAQSGQLAPNDPPFVRTAPGAGPRHLAFHPNGRLAFGINELDLTIACYDYDPSRGSLSLRETVPALDERADPAGASGAEIAVHPNGKFVYASLRGVNEIVAYRVDAQTGHLEFLERVASGGKTPRNFAIDPAGKWLLAANQDSANIAVFRIKNTGHLSAAAPRASVPSPVCLKFLAR